MTLLDSAVADHPASADLWYAWAQVRQCAFDPCDLSHMEAMLQDGRATVHGDRLHLHYALGGAYLHNGDAARAFTHYAAGARMKRATICHDPAETERWMTAIATAFPGDRIERAKSDNRSEQPIFIVGMPRSGSTLVEQILASHPKIHGAGETRCLPHAINRSLSRTGAPSYPDFIAQYGPRDYEAIADDYLSRIEALAPQAERIVDKMLHNVFYAGLIHLMFPRARIIHCRRNPVDTCLSCYTTLFTGGQEFSYDLVELGRHYRAYDALAAHWRAVLPAGQFLEVDYESVVDDLEGEARRLIDFCGLEWSPACLKFHETERPVRTASMAQVRKPLYRTSVGRARQYGAHLSPLLAALGEPPE